MNDKIKKYLDSIPILKLAQDSDEINDILDVMDDLWSSFSEEEKEYVRSNVNFIKG